ncbi:DUF1266 domain-containing protein [Methanolapillus millepedarum]|uniref:DUF1266 domain-containing protein n=1 Tax=Methanolapillus millepedarum TaxID=3028296 RepID=A0AA96VCJ4_9EURY|nr:hypothetical protein MsAc7_12380 [Methanosarcinaceae archaeon Ac7]
MTENQKKTCGCESNEDEMTDDDLSEIEEIDIEMNMIEIDGDFDENSEEYQRMVAQIQNQIQEQMQKAMGQNFNFADLEALEEAYEDLLYGDAMSDEEVEQFLAEHAVSPELAKYLMIGAVLIGTNGELYETLALTGDPEDYLIELSESWDINTPDDAIDTLNWLMAEGHAAVYQEDFLSYKIGKECGLDDIDIENYEATVEGLIEILELPKELVDACDSLGAWDIDRIGYLARIFAHVGFINEDEAWNYLKKGAQLAKEQFKTWEEYFISLLIGRGFAMGVDEEPFAIVYDLLTDSRDLIEKYPISKL